MRQYEWKPFLVPGTPCQMIGKNYSQMKEIQSRLMDEYKQLEFRLNAIAPATWRMEYSY